jgi:hypothetical protein
VVVVAALTGLVGLLDPHVPAQRLIVLYVLPSMVIVFLVTAVVAGQLAAELGR